MNSLVVDELSNFLNAPEYQVEIWDQKVITHLEDNPGLFAEFRTANNYTKWDIYASAKFHGMV
jgi:predicted lipoprotein